ncbi:DUF2663 family protein [Bacillus massiliglaciei]|uniref:DUF2663 family protein n=1 Tax=Bacillus massiliglaciei TaxID=1816693 RepID=UPI000B084045|nr:DUF2663 family protein [Bacillus massiliglaciei]
MESAIILLDEHTDQAAKQMLQSVVAKKKKYEKLKHKHIQILILAMSVFFLFMLYLYFYIVIPFSYSFFVMFSAFVSSFIHFFLLAAVIGLYGYLILIKNKMDKAEKEYHKLRCEIIQKSKQLWEKEEEWKNRHKVFDMMKKQFDINLYTENK